MQYSQCPRLWCAFNAAVAGKCACLLVLLMCIVSLLTGHYKLGELEAQISEENLKATMTHRHFSCNR